MILYEHKLHRDVQLVKILSNLTGERQNHSRFLRYYSTTQWTFGQLRQKREI